MADEIELKLRIAKSDVPRLKRLLASLDLQISKPKTYKALSIYYDTPDLTLLDHGVSLRLRRAARKWLQTIKASGKSLSGLHQRMELEDEVVGGQLDFTKITTADYAKLFNNHHLREQLAPIFSTDIQRTEWQLSFDNGDQVELVVDVGELIAGAHREPICEIELELKQGNTGRLFELALLLQDKIPLTVENTSKAKRGYSFYREQPARVVKASPIKLRRKMNANEALKLIIRACLLQLQANQAVALAGGDVEGVHQMRVALRRIRSVLNVFGYIISKQSIAGMIADLKWITLTLGNARDLDVFITQTLPPILKQLPNEPSLELLAKKAKAARLQAYADVSEAVASQRYQRLLLSLEDWLENTRWQQKKSTQYTAYEVAQTMLEKRHRQVIKSGKDLTNQVAEERHITRIAAKKLRYAAEFFAPFYKSSKSDVFIKHMAQLQDQLGVLNDISVTNQLLETLIGQRPSRKLAAALPILHGWNAYKLMACIKLMDNAWQKFSDQKPFWQ